ncbi:MAG: alpha-amylase/4-alpha-glucanotransferase domain-containing protein [Pirellulales bacterium]
MTDNANIRFVLVLHNHQPIGNFDGVFQQAFEDSYRPFLDVFESYPQLRIGLHTSGSLMEWLDAHHPEYVDRLAGLVASGNIEIVGGAFFEPILAMISSRDRVEQIRSYTRWLENRLGARVRGMWIPERVWEQSMTRDLVDAGIQYTLLDDTHFKNAGLHEDALHGYYVTEDDGKLLFVFPGSERLRYLIPFGPPEGTIEHLREVAEQQPGATVVFADDGEKFGTWPETNKHVYDDGWLRRFFDLLVENSSWIKSTTPSEVLHATAPRGKVYLPEGSYREMTEWALPTERLSDFEDLRHEFQLEQRWARVAPFMRGGFWRNFKVKYPESDEMYTRMQQVSRRLHEIEDQGGADLELLNRARRELFRGQCNCSYWHGAFGGIYLPHLRNAVYRHLILADNLLDHAIGRGDDRITATAADYNLDARQEVELASDRLLAYFTPATGGQLYELDVRPICHNLLATLARRPEEYHRKVLAGPSDSGENVASIHERVVFKQKDLDQRLQYDTYRRKSLIDHFFDADTSLDDLWHQRATERGDFVEGVYKARIRRSADRVQVQLTRDGRAADVPVRITKTATLHSGGSTLRIGYLLENLPPEHPLHFAVELNFAGMPSGADDRYFYDHERQQLGQLGTRLDLHDATQLGLVDQWQGLDVSLALDRPSGIWTFPIETVSQSEGGFELVHQSVAVLPHWHVVADERGRWSVTIDLAIDTSQAESRRRQSEAVVSS